jgi:hypothetical protein
MYSKVFLFRHRIIISINIILLMLKTITIQLYIFILANLIKNMGVCHSQSNKSTLKRCGA